MAAAETNALTEIEAVIAEIHGLGGEGGALAEEIAERVAHYDTEGIAVLARQAEPVPEV